MTALPALALTACVNDSSDCPEDETQDKGVYFRFDIVTRDNSSFSRALHIDPKDSFQTGSAAENYLNIPDLLFLIYDSGMNFLCPLTPNVQPENGTSNYTRYSATAVLYNPYFTEAESGENINFYIVVLANYSGLNPSGINIKMDMRDLFGDESGTFTFAPLTYPGWYPHINQDPNADYYHRSPQYMPMTGLQSFSIPADALMASSPEQPLNISDYNGVSSKDINLLRAVAKIEIVDRAGVTGTFTDEDNNGPNSYMRIEKVQIDGVMSAGTILPYFNQWQTTYGVETQYVSTPTVPDKLSYMAPVALNEDGTLQAAHSQSGAVINFVKDTYAQSIREDNCPVFSAYVYEYDINRVGEGVQKPYMRINIRGSAGDKEEDIKESANFPLQLGEYTNGKMTAPLSTLLRNNIYRYEVTNISMNTSLSVVWTICPMDNAEVNIPNFE